MSSIKISPKHGVNPCIPVCIFCGQQKNELALLGKLENDAEAPMSAVIDYEPCDECLSNWAKGVALLKVSTEPLADGMPPVKVENGKELYPVGAYSVITTDAAKRIFDLDLPAGSPVFIDGEVYDSFLASAKEAGAVGKDGETDG